jgi:hypothetical protein
MLLPLILVLMIILCNDRRLLGCYVNGHFRNWIAWITTIVITVLMLLIILTTLFPGFSVDRNLPESRRGQEKESYNRDRSLKRFRWELLRSITTLIVSAFCVKIARCTRLSNCASLERTTHAGW